MADKLQLRSEFDRYLKKLSASSYPELSVQYDYPSRFGDTIDVVLSIGDTIMALGRFCPPAGNKKGGVGTLERLRLATLFPEDVWYVFDFDGTRIVINDLSDTTANDACPATIEEGLNRLCTLPLEWKEMEDTVMKMKRFLELLGGE